MTYGEAVSFINGFLRGDNSNPGVLPLHFESAFMEIESNSEPSRMTADYTGSETDVFRLLPPEYGETPNRYLKKIEVADPLDESAEMPIDEPLFMAVVFYVCSYLSNKKRDYYEKKAEKIVSVYRSNVIP